MMYPGILVLCMMLDQVASYILITCFGTGVASGSFDTGGRVALGASVAGAAGAAVVAAGAAVVALGAVVDVGGGEVGVAASPEQATANRVMLTIPTKSPSSRG